MKLRVIGIILILLALVTPLIGMVSAFATSTTYNHIIPIVVTDTSGVARTNVPVIITYDVDSQITLGLLNSTATDADMQVTSSSINFMMAAANITAIIPSLPAYGSVTMSLYTGYAPEVSNYPVIVGAGGYVTVADDATLEPGNSWKYILSNASVDTATPGSLLSKQDAMSVVTGSSNITVTVNDGSYYSPDSASGWTNSANAINGNIADYADINVATVSWSDYLVMTLSENVTMSGVEYYYTRAIDAFTNMEIDVYDGTWNNVFTGDPDPASTYNEKSFSILTDVSQIRIRFYNSDVVTRGVQVNDFKYQIPSIVSKSATAGETTDNATIAQQEFPFLSVSDGTVTDNLTPVTTDLSVNMQLGQDEFSGATWTTMDSNALTATATNTTWVKGSGILFDSATDEVKIPDNDVFSGGTSAVIELWLTANTADSTDTPLEQWGESTPEQAYIIKSNGTQWYLTLKTDAGLFQCAAPAFTLGVPQHYMWVWDGTNITSYLNGVAGTVIPCTGTMVNSTNAFVIGAYDDDGTIYYTFDGTIHEVRIYKNISFTPDQNYNATKDKYQGSGHIRTVSTLASVPDNSNDWTMVEGDAVSIFDELSIYVSGVKVLDFAPTEYIQADTLTDESGNGNDGTITWGSNSNLTITQGQQVTTNSATSIGATSVLMQGTLDDLGDYANAYVSFEYGLTTDYGYFTSETSVASPQDFSVTLTGLTPNTTYHYRALARNGSVYAYGADTSFTSLVTPSSGGSTTPLITIAGVFGDYIDTGDLLVVAEINNTYPPYYPTANPAQYFQMQLVDTDGTTILGASPLTMWGDRPASIYFGPTVAATLTQGAAYYIRIQSISSDISSSENYTLLSTDWKGNDLNNLDEFCISAAANMQLTDGTSLTDPYLSTITDYGVVITDAAGGYFTKGIPGIAQIRPGLFTTGQTNTDYAADSGSSSVNYNTGSTLAGRIGTQMATDATTVATVFGITNAQFLNYLAFGGILLIVIAVVSNTKGWGALGAFCLCAPLLGATTYLNVIGIAVIGIILVIFAFLFVRQFVWKTL